LELKLAQSYKHIKNSLSYNRTILELKQFKNGATGGLVGLIIAPYWNWNCQIYFLLLNHWKLIIAPYWNWNLILKLFPSLPLILIIAPYWNWNIDLDTL